MGTTAIGIDIGGTFIDIVTIDEGTLCLYKVPSTPEAPAQGVIAGLTHLIEQGRISPVQVGRIAHGSTVATNALLEGKWAKTALITTRGFRDVLEIGRQDRPDLYDLFFERPALVVPRNLRLEISERVDYQGKVLRPLKQEEVHCLIPQLQEAGVEAVAVVFLFSFLNPAHERAVRRILEAEVDVPITLSSDVLPEFREYERTSTTVVSAALRPVLGGYLTALEDGAKALGLPTNWQIMQSSGAITRARHAETEPARILLSGPAAGVEGARAIGRLTSFHNLITMDMGGTSCDVSLIRGGEVGRTTGGRVGSYPIALPMVEIHTIGAGGGSIAWLDRGGALRVGPRSAGASPGPACYGRGGDEPTVTDAHLVLGHLLPDHPLGGLTRLDLAAARKAIEKVAEPFSLSVEEVAFGILEVADAAMERAIRVISIERGHDPRDFALLAFGGAGPLHAVSIAQRLAIPKVIVPAAAGVLSAFGLLAVEVGHDYSQGLVQPLCEVDREKIEDILSTLRQRGEKELAADGVIKRAMTFRASADLRYLGQAHELNIPLSQAPVDDAFIVRLESTFHEEHRRRYGHAAKDESIELVTVRMRAVGPPARIEPARLPDEGAVESTATRAWFNHSVLQETQVFHRNALSSKVNLVGPAIVLGEDATILLPPGTFGRVDHFGNLILEVR